MVRAPRRFPFGYAAVQAHAADQRVAPRRKEVGETDLASFVGIEGIEGVEGVEGVDVADPAIDRRV